MTPTRARPNGDEPAIRDARRAQWRHLEPWLSSPTRAPAGVQGEAREGVGRRAFLRLAGASAGLAGLGSCTRAPDKEILPYSTQPREVGSPGTELEFAL